MMKNLVLSFSDAELPDLDRLLDRALNCWELESQPSWALGLSDRVKARLAQIDAFNQGTSGHQEAG